MMADLTLCEAVHYLRLQGEQVEETGLFLWRVGDVVQSAAEVIAYADDLRRIDNPSLSGSKPGGNTGRSS